MILGGRVRFTAAGRALRHRNFRFFFFGQLISVTGTWMQTLAQGWLLGTLVGWDQAVVYIGLLGVVQFLPVLVLGLFGGIIADIWPKRRTVIGTQTVAGMLALTLGGLVYFHVVQVWHIFVLAFLLGLVNAVDMPARQSFVVEMVGPEDVANAVALNSAVFNGARIVGPAIAGVLIGVLGHGALLHPQRPQLRRRDRRPAVMRDCELHAGRPAGHAAERRRGSVRTLARVCATSGTRPVVLLAIAVIGFVSTFGMNFNVVLPVMAGDVLNVGPDGLRLAVRGDGRRRPDGGPVRGHARPAAPPRPGRRRLVLGVSELVLAGTTSFPVALAAVFFAGVGAIADGRQRQLAGPDHRSGPLRGRVMSVYTTVFAGSTPIGNGLTGGFGGLWGTPVALAMNGLVTIGAEAMAAVAVLRGFVPRIGGGSGDGRELKDVAPGQGSGGGRRADLPPRQAAR